MEITIKINGQAVSVEVSYEIYEYLCERERKVENLSHQKGSFLHPLSLFLFHWKANLR